MPEQALDGIPLGLGSVVKINLLNFHVHVCVYLEGEEGCQEMPEACKEHMKTN